MRQEYDLQSLDILEVQKAFKKDESMISSNTQNNDWIPAEWKLERFEDVCSLRKETIQPAENHHAKYVGLEHIDSGTPYLERWGVASEVISSKSKFYKDDVLYGKLRPYLDKAVLAEFDGICSTDILVFKSGTLLTSTFLSYLVHTRQFLDYAVQNMHGVNHPRTSWSSLAKYQLSLPPLLQQQAIAKVLYTVRKAIQARRDELELERERKAALTEYLFTHGTCGELTKQTEIGNIPESWRVIQLDEVSQLLQYGTSVRCDADASGIPVLRIPNIIDGRVDIHDLKYIKLPETIVNSLRLELGDLLFVRTNGNKEYAGRCAVFHNELPQALFASYLIRVRLKPATLTPKFIQSYTMTHKGKGFLSGRAISTADGKYNINSQTIRSVLLPFPSLQEQDQIVNILDACDVKISALEQELMLLEELFKALLEELMTGRLSTLPLIEEGEAHE